MTLQTIQVRLAGRLFSASSQLPFLQIGQIIGVNQLNLIEMFLFCVMTTGTVRIDREMQNKDATLVKEKKRWTKTQWGKTMPFIGCS